MSEEKSVADRVMNILKEHFSDAGCKVIESSAFVDDLGVDSLDLVELVFKFEAEFGLQIPEDVLDGIYENVKYTVKDVIDFIEKAKKEGQYNDPLWMDRQQMNLFS